VLVSLWLTALLTVVLDGSTIDPSSLETAVAGCEEALSSQDCSAADASPASQTPDFYVRLSADDALASVQIEVLRGGPDGARSLSRALSLDAAASREERARTIGLVVAAHVLDVQRAERAAAPREVPPPPRAPRPVRMYSLDAAASVGSALDSGALRGGLLLRGTMLARSLPFGLLLALHGAYRPGHTRISWLGASVGALVRQRLGAAPLSLEGRVEAVGQHTLVRAEVDDTSERAGQLRWGGRVGAELHVRLSREAGLFAGAEGSLLSPRVDVFVGGRPVGSEPALSWSALLGARKLW
jgi:hypothetical protein